MRGKPHICRVDQASRQTARSAWTVRTQWREDDMAGLRHAQGAVLAADLSVGLPSVAVMSPLPPADTLPSAAAVAAWPDWPEPTDEEIDRWWAERVALEEGEPPAAGDDDAAVVAAAEAEPLSPALVAALESVDVRGLDDAGLVSAAVAWTRVRNLADAQVAASVAELHSRSSDVGPVSAHRLVAAEMGMALRLGTGGADRLVTTAVELAKRLPATLAAMRDGSMSWQKAATLADRTQVLDDATAAAVEARVLPHAAARTPALHAAAVRRTADRLDPASLDERRRRAEATIALARTHLGDGMGELFARLPSDELDTIYLGADTYARRCKAAGDARTLERLRVAALVQWASAFLGYGDPTATEPPDDPDVAPPTRHGRPARVRILTSLPTLLGRSDAPGELADSGALVPATTIRSLASRGVVLRRLLVDDDTGELADLTHESFRLPAADGVQRPVCHELAVVVRLSELPALRAELTDVPPALRNLLDAPVTAETLDATLDAYPVPVRLAEFATTRERFPSNPCAGESAASAGDIDHIEPVANGGRTTRDNLHAPTRRWHLLRTHTGWRVDRYADGTRGWTSPLGRTAVTRPHDYRSVLDDDP